MKEKKEDNKELKIIEKSEKASLSEVGSNFVKPDMEEDYDTEDIQDIIKQIRQSDVVTEEVKEELVKHCLNADQIIKKTDGGNSIGKQERREGMTRDLQSGISKKEEKREIAENEEKLLSEKNKDDNNVQEI